MEIGEKVEEAYSIVTTTRAKYFGIVKKKETGIIIDFAYELNTEKDAQAIASGYIRGRLYGENKRIELSDALVESVTDAPDETRIVKTYEALIPEAKKKAIGIMTYKALTDLLSK